MIGARGPARAPFEWKRLRREDVGRREDSDGERGKIMRMR